MTESQGRDDYLPQSLLKLAGLVTEFGERRQIPAQRVIDLHQILVSLPGLDAAADEKDLEEIYNTERQLLYVACTRARDQLLVTGVEPYSEFLDDLLM